VLNAVVWLTQTSVEETVLADTLLLELPDAGVLPALLLQTASACCIGKANAAVRSATPPSTIREMPFFALIILLILFILYLLLTPLDVSMTEQHIYIRQDGCNLSPPFLY
jgi:hypothetical protein